MTEASNYILNLQKVYAANGILLNVFQAITLVEHFSMIETSQIRIKKTTHYIIPLIPPWLRKKKTKKKTFLTL